MDRGNRPRHRLPRHCSLCDSLAAYAFKALTAFEAVRTEFRHPIIINLFGTVVISLFIAASGAGVLLSNGHASSG